MPLRRSIFTLTSPPRTQLCQLANRHSRFHTSSIRRAQTDVFPDHYETLSLSPDATQKDIKRYAPCLAFSPRDSSVLPHIGFFFSPHCLQLTLHSQYFTLSKRHHPDTSDSPDSLPRFHAITDAYHTLVDPATRSTYDRDYVRVYNTAAGAPAYPAGSHASHTSSYAGSRPASGLSRRRTRFRGPPPSFYRNGRYGTQSAKRQANEHASAGSEAEANAAGQGMGGGFGPGQSSNVFGGGTPHFDTQAHRRTHESIINGREARRRATGTLIPDDHYEGPRYHQLTMFLMLCAIVTSGVAAGGLLKQRPVARKEKRGQ
ncbi:hypothetical protein EJ05DRAFT_302964 [Pseudovirgaria hyperparasitica]|uniref:J domain-containing protein n=1 Tax=Pseudovirgaria hyperparasitica TaxID=470096 RepID=A0A6A6WBP8_9PEZI|nr:uncharacterized protein EJ05DRAFT_302964 [Pseudovirgaria hyperparasitica]KAF2759589.1 hypothetical protein EJ05DRAFT_302964 [Pseudovirgaria hyperparasitica]